MPSKYLIFDTQEAAQNKQSELYARLEQHYLSIYEKSESYCILHKHPLQELWAIIVDTDNFPLIFSELEVNEAQLLDLTWYETPTVND